MSLPTATSDGIQMADTVVGLGNGPTKQNDEEEEDILFSSSEEDVDPRDNYMSNEDESNWGSGSSDSDSDDLEYGLESDDDDEGAHDPPRIEPVEAHIPLEI